MKNTYLIRTFIALVSAGVLSACVSVQMDPDELYAGRESLALNASVSEGTVATKAASQEPLKETYIHTLDVFVEHVTNGTGDGTFIRQYHLTTTDEAGIPKQVDNLLAAKWRTEGLEIGQYYNIYVATNNSQTKDSTFNVAALKALVADEVTDRIALINEDNNVTMTPDKKTTGNIYKLYDETPGSYRALTAEKEFMMDGVIKNWTPDPAASDQVFKTAPDQPLLLSRAAAKFVVNVKFDADFLASLAEENVSITGYPAWRFQNFAFGAPVFTPETQGAGVEVHNSDFNIFHNQTYKGDDKHFQIITYSYPNIWAANKYATDAPTLVVSVGYTEGTGDSAVTNYHYYRIPLVKSTVTAIERNHIYVINAKIATRGSSPTEDQDLTEDIEYAVLPWNDVNNSAAIQGEVQSVQHYYFNVNPKVYTLRGDGDQSVVLNYNKATGTKVNWKLFTYDANGNQTGVVANDAEGAVRAWFYNASGKFTTTYGDSNQNPWTNMGVNITQSTEGTSGSKGTVTVTSTALTNKSIKYIRLRVYLDEELTFVDGKETMYEDIIIRHFPTDNIQNITGSWSSYHTTSGSGTSMVTLQTFSLSEAQSWAAQYGVDYTTEDIDIVDNITYSEYTAHAGQEGYAIASAQATTDGSTFRTNVPNANQRATANSQANAVLGTDGYCYWGTNPVYQGRHYYDEPYYESSYDYYTVEPDYGSYAYYYYYNYRYRYRARYTHTYKRTQYSLSVEMASTGNWVDWDRDANKTYSGNNRKINGNGNFQAKVYEDGIINAVVVNRQGSDKTYTLKHGDEYDYYYYWNGTQTAGDRIQTFFNATNNHMYVIQISSTSDKYVLGRPVLGNPDANRSQDDVVSPAFMIASQLGAVAAFTGNNASQDAANHCGQYMEVGTDGTRYTGWRLPTRSEINVINGYQKGVINGVTVPLIYQTMVEVLGGEQYWSLAGQRIRTSDGAVVNSGDTYLRCVRDLSAEEVDRLNGFDKIQEKYR